MNSTGNDIIALYSLNSKRAKETRFYLKILSLPELKLYTGKAFPKIPLEDFVWLLWSVKESVYKYLKRSIPGLVFSPKKIIIQEIDFTDISVVTAFESPAYDIDAFPKEKTINSIVSFGTSVLFSRSEVYHELIHTVVCEDKYFKNIYRGIQYIDQPDCENQSLAVRSFLLKRLNAIFPNDHLEIVNNSIGYPVLLNESKELDIPISFAHHDHFIAYSFLLKNPGAIS